MSEPLLETRGLSKRFGALTATDDVSIDVRPGEVHAIIGPNGAGKSTLIKQIAGELSPDAGKIFLAGEDIAALQVADRARAGLARTFQVSQLAMEDTAFENVLLGSIAAAGRPWRFWRRAIDDAALQQSANHALERVGLADQRDMRCSALSHGQRRQLEVAIALTLCPRVFLMDEPMAGLGAEGSLVMTGFLDQLRNEAPILLIEHDMDAVFALADRISVLVSGKVIATGSVSEIRSNPDVRAAYLGDAA